ncbi:hypothetical protein Dimus_016733 [Dionaea muscipula]
MAMMMMLRVAWMTNIIVLMMIASTTSDTITITCGTESGGTDSDGRRWEPETKFLASTANTLSATAQVQDPSVPSAVPYMTARIMNGEATYKFAVNATSRYSLRLHFYPAAYGSLNISNSYFSVNIGNGITLLNIFSAAITAQALTQAYIIKEYELAPVAAAELSLTFKPSDKYKGAFAFVNGIEVVALPELFDAATMVGFSDQSVDGKASNFETLYRLNVGGNYIAPTNDSAGLLRTWYDDTPYLYGANAGVTSSTTGEGKDAVVNWKETPRYMAPEDVYATWRSMGPDPNLTLHYNLTWQFQVDPNFMYFMRLHFCEHLYSKTNQRVFYIYINNQSLIQDGADVIAWAGAKDVPTYKDYAIFVPNTTVDAQLWLALHPKDQNNGDAPPEYYDAILNGLEIFKVNDANKNLAGPNPTPSEALLKAEESQRQEFKNDSNKTNIKIIGAASGAAAFGIAAVVCIAMYQKKNRYPRSKSGTTSWLPIYGASTTQGSKSTIGGSSVASAQLSSEAAANCRHFSLVEIKKATKNFDESHVIGVGGFGKVYRGVIDGTTKVAIKRSNPSSEQGVHEFVTEIEMLSKLRHKHLVSLIGYCEEEGEMVLVYDYMAHGTLREHLYKGNKINLTWKQRLEILIGAAKGLHYLHTGAKYTIIHRDVKTTNILLDENWVAKVSDFGLSKTGPEVNQNHVSTVVKGSFGYLDPEYFRRQQLTEKSDVYSFGVVLFEVLCARPALNPSLPKEQVSLADWALLCARKGTIEDLIDPHIKGSINPECLHKFLETAQKCLSDQGIDRPSMSDLLWNLEFALQLQDCNGGDQDSNKYTDPNNPPESMDRKAIGMHYSTLSLGSDDEFSAAAAAADDDDQNSSTAIFSQIVHPTGR